MAQLSLGGAEDAPPPAPEGPGLSEEGLSGVLKGSMLLSQRRRVLEEAQVELRDGWNTKGGDEADQLRCYERFGLSTDASLEEQEHWFKTSIWAQAVAPAKWKVEACQTRGAGFTLSSLVTKGAVMVSKTSVVFGADSYQETLWNPVTGGMNSSWVICQYLSPTKRIVRVVDGFISDAEREFPFAVATLRTIGAALLDGQVSGANLASDGTLLSLSPKAPLVYDLESPIRGTSSITLSEVPFKYIKEIGAGFYNIRTPFKMLGGLIDVGNHMSFCRLESGNFVAVDAVDPASFKGELKGEIDRLTCGGQLIEAVIATHPFHTVGFPGFRAAYPHAKYYGTPRHLQRFQDDEWHGVVTDPQVQNLWAPEIEIRIPSGTEFVNPQPPTTNHFANAFVFHRAGRSIHNDDCICYFDHPARKMGLIISMLGVRHDTISFHSSLRGPGLNRTAEGPREFEGWMEDMLRDWEFDHLCTAHNGNCLRNAKSRVQELLDVSRPVFSELSERNRLNPVASTEECQIGAWSGDPNDPNHECG